MKKQVAAILPERPLLNYGLSMNPHVAAVDLCYNHHQNLVITPHNFWLILVQGVSTHINKDPEKYREFLVTHSGQESVVLDMDNIAPETGFSDNEEYWTNIIEHLTDKVSERISAQTLDLIIQTFTTSTRISSIILKLVLLESLKPFFEYKGTTRCGIPLVKLEGTKDDWNKILNKVDAFKKLGLGWWVEDHLKPVIKELVKVFDQENNPDFFNRIYSQREESGLPMAIDGWWSKLFLYIKERGSNNLVLNKEMRPVSVYDFPTPVSNIDFLLDGKNFELRAGVFGITEDKGDIDVATALYVYKKSHL